MKKNILFVIHGMDCGGAEKSLISLFEHIPEEKYNIDLIVGNPNGVFMNSIPAHINLIKDCYMLENFATPLSLRRKKIAGPLDFILQVKWQIQRRIDQSSRKLSYSEFRWKIWGKYLPKLKKNYDLAISYMNGFPNYYVIEKVSAPNKIIWVHNEFEKLGYNKEFQKKYFDSAYKVITISDSCATSILNVYPEMRNKVSVLENISSGDSIKILSQKKEADPFFDFNGIRILSVGRLMHQKNFELAIDAAAVLKKRGYAFKWFILGEGELRESLENRIKRNCLEDNVVLCGIRTNPYPYIKNCDVFVQSSLYEGKSIALDEAKILQKPIVITNYPTGINSIEDHKNGLVVEMNPNSLADGIALVLEDENLRNSFISELQNEAAGNEREIEKYIKLIDDALDKKAE